MIRKHFIVALLFAASVLPSHAATRSVFSGGLYVDALPIGVSVPIERVVLYPGSRLETQTGRIDFPADEAYGPMFLILSEQGDKFVGLAHDMPGRLLLYHAPHGWDLLDLPTSGRVVFDASGGILDLNPAGYQYFDEATNQPVSRIDTYGPFHGLSEWVKVGDLYVGQGHSQGGIRIWDGSRLRVLDEGLCFFLRRHVRGDRVALSYVKSGEGAVIWQTTISELSALPVEVTDPPPPPPPPPPPAVDCGVIPDAGQVALRALATQFASEIRSPDDDVRRVWALRAAEQLAFTVGPEWGTKRADNGRPLSKDSASKIVDGRLCNWDLVNGGTRELTLGRGEDITGQVFVPVTPRNHLGPPPPPPPPTCGWPDQRVLVAQLSDANDAKARRIATLNSEKASCESHNGDIEQQLAAVKQELEALKAKPAPTCTAKVETPWARSLGAKASCTINR